MAKSLMPEVAKILGVEIGEKFKVADKYNVADAIITDESFCEITRDGCYSPNSILLHLVLKGEWELQKLPWEPKRGESYYAINIADTTTPYIAWHAWNGYVRDYVSLQLGIIYKTKEEAQAHMAEDYERLTGRKLEEQNND